MTNLVPLGRNSSSVGLMRDVARQIEATKGRAAASAAEIMATGYVVESAMHTVASFSSTEETLASKVPLATSRLQAIGDSGALRIAAIIREM